MPEPTLPENSVIESHLFTVRTWWEDNGEQQREMRMQVRHVLTGETRYFRDAQTLLAYFAAKLEAPPAGAGESR